MKQEISYPKIPENIAIKVEQLFSIYNEYEDNEFVCLCDNNLELEKNKIHFIIGNSGCGKSTLVNHFNGLIKVKYGNIYIQDGHTIGNNFFIKKFLIGVIDEKTIDFDDFNKLNKNQYIFAFHNFTPKHIAKILIEAYYKTKVTKIKHIAKNFNHLNLKIFIITFDDSLFELDLFNKINWKKIKNNKNNLNFKKNYFLKKKLASRKKIKNIKKLKKTVGLVFQFPEYQLFKDTVLNDVMFGPLTLKMDKDLAKQKSIHYLKKLGIPEHLFSNSPFNLSGGQKRRVAISGILAFDPKIIVFDEPTAWLDPFGDLEILNIVKESKKEGKTIVVISHNMDHVLEIADNVIVMNEGEIIKTGTPYEIFTDNKLLKYINIDPPKIIDLINKLSIKDKKFKKLYDLKPTNTKSLGYEMSKLIKL